MYKTKFNRDWSKQFPCIIADDASQHHFRCTVCMRTISCGYQGLTDVSRHCESDTHKRSYKNQIISTIHFLHREKFRIPKLDIDPQSLGGKA